MFPSTVLKLYVVCLISLISASNIVQATNSIVEIPLGKLQGTVLKTDNNNDFYAFRGIPYAKPPIKDLRFKAPEPIERWNGIHDATEDGHRCLQLDVSRNNLISGDEDCLFLNVYSQRLTATSPRPVMVFIHGGAFIMGDGRSDQYGPERFLDKDIVLVTLNYRLSALGFLSTEDKASPGNYGLLDQVQALRWVRDNVAAFGGDPQRVTIFGESAGSASVIYHLLSPLSKGLFHAAIAQSGTATCPWAFHPKSQPLHNARQLAERLDCPTDNSEALVQCLRRRAALDVAMKSSLYDQVYLQKEATTLHFLPVVDEGYGREAFLPEEPQRLMKSNRINKVPVMIGIDRDEGFLIMQIIASTKGGLDNFHVKDIEDSMRSTLLTAENVNRDALNKRITRLSHLDLTNQFERITAISDLFGDIFMNHGMDKTIATISAHGIPTYAYKFTYKGEHTFAELLLANESDAKYLKQLNVVTHADELQYQFKAQFVDHILELNEMDTKMSDIILTLWTNFAYNRVPSLDGSNAALQWTPVQDNRPDYLNINLKPIMETGTFSVDSESNSLNDFREEL